MSLEGKFAGKGLFSVGKVPRGKNFIVIRASRTYGHMDDRIIFFSLHIFRGWLLVVFLQIFGVFC